MFCKSKTFVLWLMAIKYTLILIQCSVGRPHVQYTTVSAVGFRRGCEPVIRYSPGDNTLVPHAWQLHRPSINALLMPANSNRSSAPLLFLPIIVFMTMLLGRERDEDRERGTEVSWGLVKSGRLTMLLRKLHCYASSWYYLKCIIILNLWTNLRVQREFGKYILCTSSMSKHVDFRFVFTRSWKPFDQWWILCQPPFC